MCLMWSSGHAQSDEVRLDVSVQIVPITRIWRCSELFYAYQWMNPNNRRIGECLRTWLETRRGWLWWAVLPLAACALGGLIGTAVAVLFR
jgi:hypothetical protein